MTRPNDTLEHITYWSDIRQYFDVVDTSIRRQMREIVGGKKDNRVVAVKESHKIFERRLGYRKKRLSDSVGPKTGRRSCPFRETDCLRDASYRQNETKHERNSKRTNCPPRRKGCLEIDDYL